MLIPTTQCFCNQSGWAQALFLLLAVKKVDGALEVVLNWGVMTFSNSIHCWAYHSNFKIFQCLILQTFFIYFCRINNFWYILGSDFKLKFGTWSKTNWKNHSLRLLSSSLPTVLYDCLLNLCEPLLAWLALSKRHDDIFTHAAKTSQGEAD